MTHKYININYYTNIFKHTQTYTHITLYHTSISVSSEFVCNFLVVPIKTINRNSEKADAYIPMENYSTVYTNS